MGVYLFVVLVCLLCVYKYDVKQHTSGCNMAFWCLCLMLILVAGLRYQIGADTINYMEEFQYTKKLSELSSVDFSDTRFMPGWIIFASACKTFCSQFIGLQLIHAIILNVSIFLFVRRFSQYKFMAILMYVLLAYINLNTEILRESLAMSLFLLAIVAFVKNRWFVYFLLCFVVSMFHISGFITFLFPIGKLFKISSRKRIIILSIFIFALSGVVWRFFQTNIIEFFIIGAIEDGAKAYINSEHVYNINGIIVNLTTRCIMPLIAIIYALKSQNRSSGLINLTYVYVIIGLFMVFNSVIFLRFQTYVTIPFLVILADTLVSLIKRNKMIAVTIIFCGMVVPYYYPYFNRETVIYNLHLNEFVYQRYVPYKIWPAENQHNKL